MEHPSKFSKKEKRDMARAFGLMAQIGLTMALCIFFGVLLGMFLDDRLGTSPWLLLLFAFIGCGAAFKSMFNLAKKFY